MNSINKDEDDNYGDEPLGAIKPRSDVPEIDCIKVNKQAEMDEGPNKGVYYYVLTCKNKFKIYAGKLELIMEGQVETKIGDTITSIEFGQDTKSLYFGTAKGFIHKFELHTPQECAELLRETKKAGPY